MERDYCLLVFDSTHAAMSAERALGRLMKVTMMPTLRQITASCGMSLRVETADLPALIQALGRGAVPRDTCRLFRVEGTEVWEMKGAG